MTPASRGPPPCAQIRKGVAGSLASNFMHRSSVLHFPPSSQRSLHFGAAPAPVSSSVPLSLSARASPSSSSCSAGALPEAASGFASSNTSFFSPSSASRCAAASTVPVWITNLQCMVGVAQSRLHSHPLHTAFQALLKKNRQHSSSPVDGNGKNDGQPQDYCQVQRKLRGGAAHAVQERDEAERTAQEGEIQQHEGGPLRRKAKDDGMNGALRCP